MNIVKPMNNAYIAPREPSSMNPIEDFCARHHLPPDGFLRLKQILGDKKTGGHALFPVSSSTWWDGVKTGRFPQPVKLGPRTTAWRVEDIVTLIINARKAP
ncbi:prophage regulatory protein [Gammaproteobacteria bacterium]